MNTKKLFARAECWRYWKQLQRVFEGVGQLTRAGFIFPKLQNYEYQNPFQRNRIEVDRILQQFN